MRQKGHGESTEHSASILTTIPEYATSEALVVSYSGLALISNLEKTISTSLMILLQNKSRKTNSKPNLCKLL